MKRLSCLIMLALGCMLAAAPGYAQSQLKVTFTVPFSFTAGTAQLPAGSYSITEDDTGHAVIFPAQGGKTSAILLTRPAGFAPRGQASVSFTRRGERYYLDTVNTLEGVMMSIGR